MIKFVFYADGENRNKKNMKVLTGVQMKKLVSIIIGNI